ncbi:cupredoxin domain-containing protein [Candidatus Roizmanbacteria bacterium]|nr:cupredoxin domain-containing protein [Candidatus Roizmanbacteria bacterium]
MDEYNKKPLWQWITIYLIIGVLVYGLVYYFALGKKGANDYLPSAVTPTQAVSETAPSTPEAMVEKEVSVTLTADGYIPAVLTIKAGTTVTWTNNSGKNATVSSDPHPTHTNYPPLNLGPFQDGKTHSLKFDTPGTYGYHNHLDASQTGTIVVE